MVAWLPLLPSAWALRPQLVSLLAVPLLLTFLVRERHWPIPLLFVMWANVHGAVALGGVLLGAATATALVRWRVRGAPEDRRRALALLVVLPLSGLACLLTPLGTGIFHFLSDSMRRIRAVHIERVAFVVRDRSGDDDPSGSSPPRSCSSPSSAAARWRRTATRRRGRPGCWSPARSPSCRWRSWRCATSAPFSLLAVPAASHLLGPDFRLRAPRPADADADGGEHPIINLAILAVMAVATIALVALELPDRRQGRSAGTRSTSARSPPCAPATGRSTTTTTRAAT